MYNYNQENTHSVHGEYSHILTLGLSFMTGQSNYLVNKIESNNAYKYRKSQCQSFGLREYRPHIGL